MPGQVAEDLNRRAVLAQRGDHEARESILRDLKPFVQKTASWVCRRRLEWENDEELSVALEALDEAVMAFSPEAGHLLSFARAVIRRRLADFFRREKKHQAASLAFNLSGDDLETRKVESSLAWERYEAERTRQEMAQDLEIFRDELASLGFTLRELAQASPSHRDTRDRLKLVAREIAGDPQLVEYMKSRKALPQKELTRRLGVSARVLSRGRAYIMALVLAMTMDDVPYLTGFLGMEEWER